MLKNIKFTLHTVDILIPGCIANRMRRGIHVLTTKWIQLVCLVLIPLVFAVGCSKREAQKQLTLAQEAKDRAQQAQAPGYAPQEFNEANRLINLAQQQFESGEYEQAIATANEAVARFEGTIPIVAEVRERVQQARDEIDQVISQAEVNVEQARQQGLESDQIQPVADTVNQLRQQFTDEISTTVIDQDELSNFLAQAQQALQETEPLATAHLQPEARDAIQSLQDQIEQARELKADVYDPGRFATIMDQVQQLQTLMDQGEWQQVIDQAGQLQQPINEVIQAAQQQSAGEILEETQNRIAQARQLNIEVPAFQNAVQQAQSSLEQGRTERLIRTMVRRLPLPIKPDPP